MGAELQIPPATPPEMAPQADSKDSDEPKSSKRGGKEARRRQEAESRKAAA